MGEKWLLIFCRVVYTFKSSKFFYERLFGEAQSIKSTGSVLSGDLAA